MRHNMVEKLGHEKEIFGRVTGAVEGGAIDGDCRIARY